ncbi:ArsR family transcriptional regulator [Clostridium sp. E02]|uniref:ArsR/SmtB family transcription factor n=1 Tax=Clostridium sp. E02 TaxID=2487134 RepID=UPI000F534320|nr:ArsR family transcriptional regulator [Clostridium sp. E02]
MKLEYTVIEEIDYYRESIELLFRIVNNHSYNHLKNDMLKRLDIKEHVKISNQLDQLSRIEEDVKKHVDFADQDIKFYFKRFVFDDLCIAKILYQSIKHSVFSSDKKEMKRFIKQSFDNLKNDNTMELTLANTEIETSVYEKNQSVSFTERIGNLECEPAQKWQLLELMEHSGKHLDKLFEILDQMIARMKKHEKILEELKKESSDYWIEYFKENDFLKLISSFYNIKEDSFPRKPAFIRTQIMCCDRVIFNGNDENAGDYHILDVGITFDCEFRATKKRLTNEELYNGLKLLSDPSKFEILRFIRDKKAYGQEIATELKLTTATISHHMSSLMIMGLINIEKVDNKVYYQMNKEATRNLLVEAKDVLLLEEQNEI